MIDALVLVCVVGLTALLGFQAGRKTAKPEVHFRVPFRLYYRGRVVTVGVVTHLSESLHGGTTFSGSDLSTMLRRNSLTEIDLDTRSDHR